MKDYSIIDYKPVYYDQVNDLWVSSGMGGKERGDNNQVIMDTLASGGHLVLIINENDEVIGTSWLTNDKRRAFIHHFCIKEEYRRKGLGKELLENCLELARKDGYQVKLEVHVDNTAAINLYKSYGFKYLDGYMVLIIRNISST
jgi:ribosomal protein S18 acetylase RimI-like enzyme